MHSPLVSVIIPNYCHAKYLDQRIQSVLNQTYRNFEVIILDDASTDNSMEIINKYAENEYIAIIDVNKENSGCVFKQWRKGIELAKGDLVWIAESDDYCEVTFLEEMVNAIHSNSKASFAYSTTWYVDDEGHKTSRFKEGRKQCVRGKSFILKYLSLENTVQNASCALFKRKMAMDVSSKYMNYKGIGDYWFWLELAEKGDVVIVNKHLSFFRRHPNTVTSKYVSNGQNLINERELIDYIIKEYHASSLRKMYISRYQARRKKYIQFDSIEIYQRISMDWEFDRQYSTMERLIAKLVDATRNRFLIFL